MNNNKKDKWDRAQVILQPVGGLLTALAVAALGFFGSRFIESKQTEETNARLYTELTSRREEAESKLRTDMFNSIIGSFLKDESGPGQNLEVRILNLELLAYNFHEAIDLGPLFRHLDQQITLSKIADPLKRKYLERLKQAAKDVIRRQIAVLEQYGEKMDVDISFENFNKDTFAESSNEDTLSESFNNDTSGNFDSDAIPIFEIDQKVSQKKELPPNGKIGISLYVLESDTQTQELSVRFRLSELDSTNYQKSNDPYDFWSKEFWVGFYDFPMIDNTRLVNGYRFAIVLNNFDKENGSANITMIYFPGTYASLKERPYYDEMVNELINSRNRLSKKK
jgi:hypothetical protein